MAKVMLRISVGFSLLSAAVGLVFLALGHLQPPLAPMSLYRLQQIAGLVVVTVGTFVVCAGGLAMLRKRAGGRREQSEERSEPRFVPVILILGALCWVDAVLTPRSGVQYQEGHWVTFGKARPQQVVTETTAVTCLWGNLRAAGCFVLPVSLLLLSFGMAALRDARRGPRGSG